MKNMFLRIGMFLFAVGGMAIAGTRVVDVERSVRAERTAERAFDWQARALLTQVADLRAAQQAYVAAGQGEAFWMGRVGTLMPSVRQRLAVLRKASVTPGAAAALDAASRIADDFSKLDVRAREYLASGQPLMASDLIFTEGVELTAAAADRVEAARRQEIETRETVLAASERRQAILLAWTGAGCLFVLLLLTPVGRIRRREASELLEATSEPPAREGDVLGNLTIAPSPAPAATSSPAPDLAAAAQLCTDLGRVLELGELPALLERAARVLDAAGLIVWVADRERKALHPIVAHGYSDQILARMGPLSRDANNAAAAAYRAGQVRTVPADATARGAIVAPLITPDGCVGVVAAEVRRGAESSESIRALTMIVAAQLATLVGALPSSGAAQAQAT